MSEIPDDPPRRPGDAPSHGRTADADQTARQTAALEREIDLSLRRADDAALGRPARRRRPRWLIATAIVLALALAAAAALATYLWQTTDEWMAESDRLTAVATDLATERDTLTADLDQARRDLAATEEQLREAQDRITALAEEKAQTADEREVARLVAGDVVGVANQLEVCVRGQGQLITALEDVEAYDPAAVSEFARQVADACSQALAGSEEIKRQLGIE
jgi:outer membrane murein-binding lipoprotein Lpp